MQRIFSIFIEILVNGGWDDVCSMIRFPRMQQADFLRLVTREEDSLPFDKKISSSEKKYIRFSSCRINFWFAKLLKLSCCAQVLIKQVQMLLSFHQPSGRLRWNFNRSLKYHCQKQLWQVKRKLTSSSRSVSPFLQTWWGNVILIAQPFKRWFKLWRE